MNTLLEKNMLHDEALEDQSIDIFFPCQSLKFIFVII